MTGPTDAELAALAVEINRTDWDDAMDALICFARAVLARWGQPAHSGDPVAWLDPWTGAKATTDYDAYGNHGIPLYTAPQPVACETLIRQLVASLEGYRRNHNDTQPCDAEREGRAWLEGKP